MLWRRLIFCCFQFAVLWRRLILKNNGVITNSLDISSLAKVTDGYTPGHMVTAVQQVLTDRRIQQLSKKPLQSIEFVAPLARIDPIYKEEEESFKVSKKKSGSHFCGGGGGDLIIHCFICFFIPVHVCVCVCGFVRLDVTIMTD